MSWFYAIFLGLVSLGQTLLGLEIALKPPRTKHSKRRFRIAISLLGFLGILLIGIQAYQTDMKEKNRYPKPNLPEIKIQTLEGLPVGIKNDPHLRLNSLSIRNSDLEIDNFCSRLQLPEPISITTETNIPVGAKVGWRSLMEPISVSGTGNKSFLGPLSKCIYLPAFESFFPDGAQGEVLRMSHENDISGVWELTIDKIPPHGSVNLLFLTSDGTFSTNYLVLANTQFKTNGACATTIFQPIKNSPIKGYDFTLTTMLNENNDFHFGKNELRFFLEGKYQYKADGKPGEQHFLTPITFDAGQRKISSLPTIQKDGKWRRILIVFQ